MICSLKSSRECVQKILSPKLFQKGVVQRPRKMLKIKKYNFLNYIGPLEKSMNMTKATEKMAKNNKFILNVDKTNIIQFKTRN